MNKGEDEEQYENEEELNQFSDYFMIKNPLTLFILGTTSEGSGRDGRTRRGRPPTEVASFADKGRWVRGA